MADHWTYIHMISLHKKIYFNANENSLQALFVSPKEVERSFGFAKTNNISPFQRAINGSQRDTRPLSQLSQAIKIPLEVARPRGSHVLLSMSIMIAEGIPSNSR